MGQFSGRSRKSTFPVHARIQTDRQCRKVFKDSCVHFYFHCRARMWSYLERHHAVHDLAIIYENQRILRSEIRYLINIGCLLVSFENVSFNRRSRFRSDVANSGKSFVDMDTNLHVLGARIGDVYSISSHLQLQKLQNSKCNGIPRCVRNGVNVRHRKRNIRLRHFARNRRSQGDYANKRSLRSACINE